MNTPQVLRVAGVTSPAALAGAIMHRLEQGQVVRVVLRAIGVPAEAAAIKGAAAAHSLCRAKGWRLWTEARLQSETTEKGPAEVLLLILSYEVICAVPTGGSTAPAGGSV